MNISIKNIQADVNQPRKKFDVALLAKLKDSIKRNGILNPLVVEKIGTDKYQLVDGERRYRASLLLGLKEVPVSIISSLNPIDRIVKQFHLQEQHENWSGTEKAMAILKISEETKMPMRDLCDTLGIDARTIDNYMRFAQLVDKENFIKSDISIKWSTAMYSVKAHSRRIIQNEIGRSYTREDEKKMERTLVRRITEGEFKNTLELAKLKDSFTKDPKSIEKFVSDDKSTAVGLFNSTGAQGAYSLRNIRNNGGYTTTHIRNFLKIKDVKIDKITIGVLKAAQEAIKDMLAVAE